MSLLILEDNAVQVNGETQEREDIILHILQDITHSDDSNKESWLTMTMAAKIASSLLDDEGLMSITNRTLVCFLRENDLIEDGKSFRKISATIEGKRMKIFATDMGGQKSLGFTIAGLSSFYSIYKDKLQDYMYKVQDEKKRILATYRAEVEDYNDLISFMVEKGVSRTAAKSKLVKPEKEEQDLCS